jgi:hypothetical protein
MDINTTSLFAQQQGLERLNVQQSLLKSTAKAEQNSMNILTQAIEATGAAGSHRGTQLDITV